MDRGFFGTWGVLFIRIWSRYWSRSFLPCVGGIFLGVLSMLAPDYGGLYNETILNSKGIIQHSWTDASRQEYP